MVASLPLPPKQRELDTGVLTSENPSPPLSSPPRRPSPATRTKSRCPEKIKPPKVAEKPTPAPPKHPQPTPPQPNKAATGETAGIRIPQSTLELKNGTASAMVQDRTFGARFAYYVNIVNRTVAQNWYTQEADPRASVGKSVTVLFDIDRAGAPSNPRLETSSGSPSLDRSALRAVQRVEASAPSRRRSHHRRVHLPLPSAMIATVCAKKRYSFDYLPSLQIPHHGFLRLTFRPECLISNDHPSHETPIVLVSQS